MKPGQPYGEEAARELKKLILGETVEVTRAGAKTYNRIDAERAAHEKHLGLWQDANPTPPLEFRKALRQKWEKQYMRLLLILIGGVDISNLIDRII